MGGGRYVKTSELCVLSLLEWGQKQYCSLVFGTVLHLYKELWVCLLNWWRRNNFGNRTGKEMSFSGSHDMGKVIVNYFVMCLKQTKQQVCAVGLFSPMPSAAEEIGMYWTKFGQEYCLEYTLSPPPHATGLLLSLGRYCQGWKDGWAEEEVLELGLGKELLWEGSVWSRGTVQEQGKSMLSCHGLHWGQAQLLWAFWQFSLSPSSFPKVGFVLLHPCP